MADAANGASGNQVDRVAAETLIRTSVLALANGASVADMDEVIRRNASNVTHADVMAGRLNTSVIGDIINSVEQAKGSKPFNWSTATQAQIAAYIATNGITLPGYGPDGLPRAPEARANGAAQGRSTVVELGSIKAENYASTPFAANGLSFDAFKAMRKEGFDGNQITSAVNTNEALGIKVNDDPAATARLQRDTPWAVDSLKESHDALKAANDCDEKSKQAEAKGDMAGAERWRKQGETKRLEEAERHRRTQERLGREKPERQGDYENRYQRMSEGIKGLSYGDPQQEKTNRTTIEDYRRNPNDAEARKNYDDLRKRAEHDPHTRNAMRKIDKVVQQGQEAESAAIERNQARIVKNDLQILANAAQIKVGDAGLDILNDTADQLTTRAADTSNKDKNKTIPAATSSSKPTSATAKAQENKAQEKTKMVQAKLPALGA